MSLQITTKRKRPKIGIWEKLEIGIIRWRTGLVMIHIYDDDYTGAPVATKYRGTTISERDPHWVVSNLNTAIPLGESNQRGPENWEWA